LYGKITYLEAYLSPVPILKSFRRRLVKLFETATLPSFRRKSSLGSLCPDEKIPPAPGTNEIARFVQFRPLTSLKKDKKISF